MNIQEERKAFEDNQRKKHPRCDLRRWAEAYRSNIVEAAYQSWLDAKAHAVEMAKPTCEVYHLTTGWAVDPICREHYEGFASKEKAIEWALNEGYRVVPE